MVTGSDIKKARQRAGLSQAELAKKLDVSQRTIGGWERDEVSPGAAEQRLVDLLHLDVTDASGGVNLSQVDDLDLVAEVARRIARAREKEGTEHADSSAEKSFKPKVARKSIQVSERPSAEQHRSRH